MGLLTAFFFLFSIHASDPGMTLLQQGLNPPQVTSAVELTAILATAPQAKLLRAKANVNVSAYLESSSSWHADDGNVYFTQWRSSPGGTGFRVQALFDSPNLYNTQFFYPADASQIGLNPDGSIVILRRNRALVHAPTGRLLRTVTLPFTRNIDGVHVVGNGDMLFWSRNAMFYVRDNRVIWRQVLDSNAKNAQYYGVAPFFTLELANGTIEARAWKDGTRLWSHRLFAPGNTTSYYGFLADSSYLILKGYQEAHVIAPDGKIEVVHRFLHRIHSLYLHQFRKGMYCFVESNRLGFFNLESGRMEWLAELGSAPILPVRMYNDTLIFQLQDRLAAFNADGQVVWSVRLPSSPFASAGAQTRYALLRMPGGNVAYVSQAGVYFVYPPPRFP